MKISSLRSKSLILPIMSLVALLMVLFATSRIILLGNYRQLETQQTRRNVERVRDALASELDNLERAADDWASWNDTYAYIEKQNKEYRDSNLVPTTYAQLSINLMAFVHRDGGIVYAGHYDRDTTEAWTVPKTFRQRLPDLLRLRNADEGLKGILLLPEGPLLLAARPILTSEQQGPSRGTLIMGRYLDDAEVDRFADITHLSFTLYRYDAPNLPSRVQSIMESLAPASPIHIAPLAENLIAGYTLLPDIFGQPALLLQINLPREIYLQGKKSILYFLVWVSIIGLGVVVLTYFLVTKLALSRHRQELSEQRLAYLATHHAGTDLPNRTLLLDRLRQALAYAWRHNLTVAVLQIDLDNFKIVNDSLGHTVGDRVLEVVAKRFATNCRAGDTLAHLGGDDFALLLPDLHEPQSAATIARKFLESLSPPLVVAEHELFITASIGIAIAPLDGDDTETLLKNAETALYQAKTQGRNTYQFFAQAMNTRTMARLTLETDLRRALEREEFVVYYQPRIDIPTGRIVGCEALVRWRHPAKGFMSPLEFIPLAEETGLILPLGEWVLRTACTQQRAWQMAGLKNLPIAVNLSACQLRQIDLVERIEQILADTGVEPGNLELEITESVLMENVESTLDILYKLRKAGIALAMDDFGTGYSSLSYLKRFPLDLIKIDHSFVHDLTRDTNDAALVRTIIVLAQNLNLRSVAEGVETEEQLAFLRRHGCDTVQGYYFSPPISADKFLQFYRSFVATLPTEKEPIAPSVPKNPPEKAS